MASRIEIDDELAARLQPLAKARGISVRELAREILRQATQEGVKAPAPNRYTLPTRDFGIHIENPWARFAELETDEYLKLFQKK